MNSKASQSERPHGSQEQHLFEGKHSSGQHLRPHYYHHSSQKHGPSRDQLVELQILELQSAEQPYKNSLRDLGYEVTVYEARRYEVTKYQNRTFYKIREQHTHTDIGRFVVHTSPKTHKEETELVVLEINTSVDRRLDRPRAHEIIARFWERALLRDLRDLHRLYFDTVTEHHTVNVVKHHVCPLMQVAWQWHHHAPQAEISIRAPDPNMVETTLEENEAWGLLYDESKLVRTAKSLLSAYPQMARQGERFQIKRLDIIPQPNETGKLFAFDLQVSFGI